MAREQRLKLTLRNVASDRTWTNQPLEVTIDPEDHAAFQPHIEQLARDLDGRTGNPWWLDLYMVRYEGLDETWREGRIPGARH